ncbi:hypothetical protein SAMN05216327_102202 [Dyadobacter sp. SG02]|nr:hypothetical protein SAMN05216327_102202 [Dyadobacter sp. SG02]
MFYLVNQMLTISNSIDDRLVELISGGFVVVDDCYILKSLYENNRHIKLREFEDKTGFECFVNSFHVDDYIEDDFLIQSLLFTGLLFQEWKGLSTNAILEVIVSETDFGMNVKFHAMRNGEVWANDSDLDEFEEALLVVRDL